MEYLKLYNNLVKEYPEIIAINAYGKKITYIDLDKKSSKLAVYLQKKINSKNFTIAIFSNGEIENFIGMLACIKLGVYFINIDTKAPIEYIDTLCNKLNINLCLYLTEYKHLIPNTNIEKVNIEKIIHTIREENFFKTQGILKYYVATSGTTGIPKIVKKTEKALINSFKQFKASVPMIFNTITQQYAPLSFAFGLDQTLIMLIGKTQICVNKTNRYIDFNSMCSDISKNKAEVVFWASSVIKLLSKQSDLLAKIPKSIKYIVTGGEPLIVSADLIFELRNKNITLLNNYGSTETGTLFFSSMKIQLQEIEQYNKVSVGKPLDGFFTILLDEEKNEVEKGELYVGVSEFFNSYLEDDIDKKIYKIEKYPNKIFYKIGDIVEKINKNYYVIGRKDNCVNIRGYRVEIENIESKIIELINGDECCVISIENNYKENNLICYYSSEIDEKKLKSELSTLLPYYMIPILFIKTNEIAHLKNGKIDRIEMKNKYKKSLLERNCNFSNERKLKRRLKYLIENILNIQLSDECYSLTFKEIGLDSLGITDYICTVEKQENITIEDEALIKKRFNSINTLAEYIKEKKYE